MKLYHWTINRKSVEKNGFIDGGEYSAHGIRGVWFADQILGPLDGVGKGIGTMGSTYSAITQLSELLTTEIPDDVIKPFEWKEERDAGYREWCIPADIVNKYKIKFPGTYKRYRH